MRDEMNEFNLVDIHFHTEDSYDTISEKYDWSKINEHLKDKINLLVKTDHNYLGYKKYTEIKEQLDFNILPGIELNIKSTGKHVHWIFIFNDKQLGEIDSNGNVVGEEFEKMLNDILYPKKTKITDTMKKTLAAINYKDVIDLIISFELDVMVIPHLNKSAGYFDKKRNKCDLLKLKSLVNQGIILSFESKEYSQIYVDMIEKTSECIQKMLNNDEDTGTREEYLVTLNELENQRHSTGYAIVYGSDFHLVETNNENSGHSDKIERYDELLSNLFYMKALPTYKGLQMSLSDQKSRIVKYDEKEQFDKIDTNVIKKIRFNSNGNTREIELGSGINSIIGLRGSGKSYILNAIRNNTEIYRNSRIIKEINDVRIVYANDDVVNTTDINSEDYFDYIGQKNSNASSELSLYNILMDAPHNNSEFIKVLEKYTESDTNTEKESVSSRYNELFSKYNEIYQLIEKMNIELENKDLVVAINNKQETDEEKFLKLLQDIQRRLEKNIIQIDKRIDNLNNIMEVLENHTMLETYEKKRLTTDEVNLVESIELPALVGIYEKVVSNNIKFKLNLEKRKKYIDGMSNSVNSKMSIKQQTISNQINDLKLNIRKLYRLKKQTNQIIDIELKDEYLQSSYKIDSKTTIKYVKRIEYEKIDEILQNFNNSKNRVLDENSLSFKNIEKFTYENSIALVKLKNKTRSDYFTEFPYQDVIKIVEGNDEKSLYDLSPGQRTSYVLRLALSQNTNKPLLLDQPEDDLDNNTIYSYLVNELRELKVKRQIIIVSHNANIVLNSDSDRVVYCRRVEDKFSYKSMRLEDESEIEFTSFNGDKKKKNILEICCNILEGGDKALNRRIKKIGYKAIFLNGETNANKE